MLARALAEAASSAAEVDMCSARNPQKALPEATTPQKIIWWLRARNQLRHNGLLGRIVHGGADVQQEGERQQRPGRNDTAKVSTLSTATVASIQTCQKISRRRLSTMSATTLAGALGENPPADSSGQPATPYAVLAAMVHFEHMKVTLNSPHFAKALSELKQQDQRRQQAGFTLTDLDGPEWTLKSLRGKVVLVNFWAKWCLPCRKEIPDLDALYKKFKRQGLVILGISDDDATKVRTFARQKKIEYPLLLDPGNKVKKLYSVEGIPMSFVYDRNGKLVAESMDMRTQQQFLTMLADAGLD